LARSNQRTVSMSYILWSRSLIGEMLGEKSCDHSSEPPLPSSLASDGSSAHQRALVINHEYAKSGEWSATITAVSRRYSPPTSLVVTVVSFKPVRFGEHPRFGMHTRGSQIIGYSGTRSRLIIMIILVDTSRVCCQVRTGTGWTMDG